MGILLEFPYVNPWEFPQKIRGNWMGWEWELKFHSHGNPGSLENGQICGELVVFDFYRERSCLKCQNLLIMKLNRFSVRKFVRGHFARELF